MNFRDKYIVHVCVEKDALRVADDRPGSPTKRRTY
jgi:hypothetical protein